MSGRAVRARRCGRAGGPREGLARRALTLVAAAGIAALVTSAATRPARSQAPGVTPAHWTDRPWRLQAGVYGQVADVTTSPDGTVHVLDRRHRAVHRLTPFGAAREARPIEGEVLGDWDPRRLDAGPEGLFLLAVKGERSRILRLGGDGRWVVAFEADTRYNDVACLPSGGLLLSRSGPRDGPTPPPRERPSLAPGGVDHVAADGAPRGSLPQAPLAQPIGVDAAPDGRVVVINRIPVPDSATSPAPPATAEPARRSPVASRGGGGRSQADLDPVAGIVHFDAGLRYVRTEPFVGAEDVTASGAGTFVSRQTEIHRLGQAGPTYSHVSAQVHVPVSGSLILHVAASWDGARLLGGLNHCHGQGVLRFDLGAPGSPPRFAGAPDHPPLSGPLYPLRLAAGTAGPVLLQGRTDLASSEAGGPMLVVSSMEAPRPQSVQRWRWDGALVDQLGVCGGLDLPWHTDVAEPSWAVDVAADGDRVLVLGPGSVEARDGQPWPSWTWRPEVELDGEPADRRLNAVAAHGGRAAVLDAGREEVIVLGPDGATEATWSSREAGLAPPVDLAAAAGGLLLVRAAPPTLERRGWDGGLLGRARLHDSPRAVAAGAGGEAWVLTSGGWLLGYDAAGGLAWSGPTPDGVHSLDIAFGGPDGRLAVAYARTAAKAPGGITVEAAGIRLLGAPEASPAPAPVAGDCLFAIGKTAAPRRVILGQTARVALTVGGRCPARGDGRPRLLVLDTSRSMGWGGSLARSQEAALAVLQHLEPGAAPIGLLRFSTGADVVWPFGADAAGLSAALLGLRPGGDSHLGAALLLAAATLRDGGAGPGAEVIVLTDGEYTDRVQEGLAALREAGAHLTVALAARPSLDGAVEAGLARVVGDLGTVERLPPRVHLGAWAARAAGLRAPEAWAVAGTVRDELPANMALVDGSAAPPAAVEAWPGALRWEGLRGLPGQAWRLELTVRPGQLGLWPTNQSAEASFLDGWGVPRRLTFPIPQVEVLGPADLPGRAYLPYAVKGACARGAALDVALVVDTSESMATRDGPGGARRIDEASRALGDLARAALDLAPGGDQAALVSFDRAARVVAPLGHDALRLESALAGLTLSQGTRIDLGLAEAARVLSAGRPEALGLVVLVSDGRQGEGGPAAALAQAASVRAGGGEIFALSLGQDADKALMASVAGGPERHFNAPDPARMAEQFGRLSETLGCRGP